jgi:ribosomal protein S18 acetylase RimI-like enzyme
MSNESIIIRKASLNDVDNNLLNIFIDGFSFHLNERPDIFSNKSDEELKEELINKINNVDNVIVAEVNNKILGFIIFQIKEKHHKNLWIDQLVVDKNSRGKGIAKLLMNKVNEIAIQENCERIEFCCWSFNDNALGVYNHLGFEEQRVIFEKKVRK